MQENASHADQACIRSAVMPGASAKLEEADQCAHPKSDVDQAFSSDSLSMAQSKLLEDWRPEPLQLQSCQSDSYALSGSSALGKFWCEAQSHCVTCLRLLLNSNGIVFATLIRSFHTILCTIAQSRANRVHKYNAYEVIFRLKCCLTSCFENIIIALDIKMS